MIILVLTVLLFVEFTSGFKYSGNIKVTNKSRLYSTSTQTKAVINNKPDARYAILFDCDGVIVETEELHRLAYNKAFESFGLKLSDGKYVEWDVHYYDKLQNTVGGGKPKMFYHFDKEINEWPSCTKPLRKVPKTDKEKQMLVDELQDAKTAFYVQIVEEVAQARPGVLELMDECIANPYVKVGICSAATKAGFEKLVNSVVGKKRLSKLDVVIAGDDVSEKKPSPMIYNKAQSIINIDKRFCVVVEDSLVGLKAAMGAGMNCIITYTESTSSCDFYKEGANAKLLNLNKVKLNNILETINSKDGLIPKFRDSGNPNVMYDPNLKINVGQTNSNEQLNIVKKIVNNNLPPQRENKDEQLNIVKKIVNNNLPPQRENKDEQLNIVKKIVNNNLPPQRENKDEQLNIVKKIVNNNLPPQRENKDEQLKFVKKIVNNNANTNKIDYHQGSQLKSYFTDKNKDDNIETKKSNVARNQGSQLKDVSVSSKPSDSKDSLTKPSAYFEGWTPHYMIKGSVLFK